MESLTITQQEWIMKIKELHHVQKEQRELKLREKELKNEIKALLDKE